MSVMKDLKAAMQSWDKMEGASAVYYMFGWNKKKAEETPEESEKNEEEEPDYRDRTHGERNTKHLKKARFYANTPKARLKRERTELKKELNA